MASSFSGLFDGVVNFLVVALVSGSDYNIFLTTYKDGLTTKDVVGVTFGGVIKLAFNTAVPTSTLEYGLAGSFINGFEKYTAGIL